MAAQSPKTSFAQNPGRLRDLADAIASWRLSPVDLLERYIARIEAVDGDVRAWCEVDIARARLEAQVLAREAGEGRLRGALHGIPLGVKDIIDVAGIPTRCNSRSRSNAAPATADAEIVLQLRRQGMVVLGKVHTTEFAFFDPSPARNPHNLAHTPGGSSSGSAAAVAAGMVPAALGTQTVASVNRPAAYCGIAAFKPSTRSTCIYGIAPLAPSYDTVGFYGATVDDAVTLYEAAAPVWMTAGAPAVADGIHIVLPEDAHLDAAAAEMKSAWRGSADKLSKAGYKVTGRRTDVSFEKLFTLQRSTMLYETSRIYRGTLDMASGQIGEKFLGAVRDGLSIATEQYIAERSEIDSMRAAFLAANSDADVFLWPAAPDTAPEGLAWTGDPRFISPWTAIGGPVVTVPVGKAANGLPLGCILAGRPGADSQMCGQARALAAVIELPIAE